MKTYGYFIDDDRPKIVVGDSPDWLSFGFLVELDIYDERRLFIVETQLDQMGIELLDPAKWNVRLKRVYPWEMDETKNIWEAVPMKYAIILEDQTARQLELITGADPDCMRTETRSDWGQNQDALHRELTEHAERNGCTILDPRIWGVIPMGFGIYRAYKKRPGYITPKGPGFVLLVGATTDSMVEEVAADSIESLAAYAAQNGINILPDTDWVQEKTSRTTWRLTHTPERNKTNRPPRSWKSIIPDTDPRLFGGTLLQKLIGLAEIEGAYRGIMEDLYVAVQGDDEEREELLDAITRIMKSLDRGPDQKVKRFCTAIEVLYSSLVKYRDQANQNAEGTVRVVEDILSDLREERFIFTAEDAAASIAHNTHAATGYFSNGAKEALLEELQMLLKEV